MQCLYVAGTMTECLLRRVVLLWKVKNAVFVAESTNLCLLRRGALLTIGNSVIALQSESR